MKKGGGVLGAEGEKKLKDYGKRQGNKRGALAFTG